MLNVHRRLDVVKRLLFLAHFTLILIAHLNHAKRSDDNQTEGHKDASNNETHVDLRKIRLNLIDRLWLWNPYDFDGPILHHFDDGLGTVGLIKLESHFMILCKTGQLVAVVALLLLREEGEQSTGVGPRLGRGERALGAEVRGRRLSHVTVVLARLAKVSPFEPEILLHLESKALLENSEAISGASRGSNPASLRDKGIPVNSEGGSITELEVAHTANLDLLLTVNLNPVVVEKIVGLDPTVEHGVASLLESGAHLISVGSSLEVCHLLKIRPVEDLDDPFVGPEHVLGRRIHHYLDRKSIRERDGDQGGIRHQGAHFILSDVDGIQ